MSKKWAYFMAVIFLLVVRYGVLNSNYDQLLLSWGYEKTASFIAGLRGSAAFSEFMSNWGLPCFVASVLIFWCTGDDSSIPIQFLLLPICYIPFSIIGAILMTAEFRVSYLWVHPLVILPFGYLYVSFWTILIWLFEKLRLLS